MIVEEFVDVVLIESNKELQMLPKNDANDD